ncbi:MAG: hypothetical protein ABJK37_08985 [Paraglaciecola sp.]|uniref:hypothetical protein n=1 Tax=Paraglaciecola sp. TaxID=1920173 RepID=UPI00329A7298
MKLIIWIISVVISFIVLGPEQALPLTKSGVFDRFKLYLVCYENDKPQLTLEQGFCGSGSDVVCIENIKRLKSEFSICLYNRAGFGKSEQGAVSFTMNDMASWLRNLFQNADLKPPYYFKL